MSEEIKNPVVSKDPDSAADEQPSAETAPEMTAKEKRKSKKDLKKALKKAKALEKKANGFWADFKKFVAKGNVIDLAVAVVVSAAFNKLLNSIVSNVFNPIISAIVPHKDLSDWKIVLVKAVEADEKEGIAAVEEVAVRIGLVIQALIEFLIIALSLFLVIRVLMNIKNALRAKERKASEEKARLAAEKKRQEEKEAAEREERIRREFINDVAVQADVLTDIKEILLRMEENSKKQ